MNNIKKMVYLNRNESQYLPSPNCLELLNHVPYELITSYSPTDAPIDMNLIKYLSNFVGVPEHCIALGNGAEDLLKSCIHQYLRRGENLLAPECSWWYYGELVAEIKGRTCHFKMTEQNDSFVFDFNSFVKAYNECQPSVVLLASPNNPTGNSLSIDTLEQVLKYCKNSIVIIDEVYWGFKNTDNSYCRYFIEKYPNAIFIRSFSKFFGLAGLRIGYAICSDYFFDLHKYNERYLGHNQLAVAICIAAIKDIDYYININKDYIKAKLAFYSAFPDNDLIKVFKSDANFLLIKHDSSLYETIKNTFDNAGYIISYLRSDLLKDHIRISLGLPEQNQQALQLLQQCLNKP